MSEPKPKKMVSRNVAIALGIICIVLGASLAGTLIVLNDALNNANQQNTNLRNIVNLSTFIIIANNVNLSEQIPIVNHLGNDDNLQYDYRFGLSVNYSGLIKVQVQPFNSNTTVEVGRVYTGYTYQIEPINDLTNIFGEGTNYYPVVGSGNNPALSLGATIDIITPSPSSANVTITYYY